MTSRTVAVFFSLVTVVAASASWQADREQALREHAAGNYRESERLFRSALEALKQSAPSDPHIPEILNDLGADCHLLGKYSEAERLYEDALSAWRSHPATPADLIARGLSNLATAYRALARYHEAEAAYRDALHTLHGARQYAAQYAFTLSNLADLYRTQDDPAHGLKLAKRAVTMLEDVGESTGSRLAYSVQTLAAIERALGDLEEAGNLYRKALALTVAQNGEDHPATAAVKINLADIDLKLGRYAEAEALSREAMSIWQRKLGPAHPRVGVAAANLAQALRFQERYSEAASELDKALEIVQGADRVRCLSNYADMSHQQGKVTQAVDFYRKALDEAQRSFGADHPQTALIMTRLAEVRRSQGLYAESVKLYRRALPILEAAGASEVEDLRAARKQYDDTLREASRTMLLR
jgi:tetratricopeptide (TPR) repeat protein